ncbi:type I inositol polyphosphate 5-phosphatase 10 isoform X2 [Punica granatum]|uniref:Type I inositol polyphosphate 5-phosphatase 10 isoform X2 n=1 Tax=Punica granatum TaxID=22663 RepID=A0A6P8BWA7_PUNGR|nr:type I inositol polyphosphate 5-phosphatase 10 isoform X2 [Punica granatum]
MNSSIDEELEATIMTLMNQDRKKKSFIEIIQGMTQRNERDNMSKDSPAQSQSESAPESTSCRAMGPSTLDLNIQTFRFQEIVPLNAGNVLVIEDNEPAAKWLALIDQSLNKPTNLSYRGWKPSTTLSGSLFFPKPSLKRMSKIFRVENGRRLKACNCTMDLERKNSKDFCFRCQQSYISEDDLSSEDEDDDEANSLEISDIPASFGANNHRRYSLVASKQMVGIFVCVWMRTELIQYVGHLRISCISRGIMGCLGNKGCISVSMSFHQTSFCFICSHLASGEKEGDELRRNLDVIEILKNTQFRKICRSPQSRMPTKILGHDRVIWLGDLNYRIALSYSETKKLMEANQWDALLDKDQLKIEREAGRVFKGWKEGKIFFPPTYKYSYNSDAYAGDTVKSKNKRRTPAWCDRILWYGNGIRQLSYIRGESRFSDHRPVCAEFLIDAVVGESGSKGGT